MEDVFRQSTKMMEKMFEPWKEMLVSPPWLKQTEVPFTVKWSPWIGTMRSTYELSMTTWSDGPGAERGSLHEDVPAVAALQ